MSSTLQTRSRRDGAGGQVIILFALSLVALLTMAALLFDGGSLLVKRRQLQNGGDAAALAAVNKLQTGVGTCTSDRVAKTGTSGSNDLWLAAAASVKTNLGWTDAQVSARMTLSCPNQPLYAGGALKVVLSDSAPGVFGATARNVSTTSLSVNGQIAKGDFSVALLDPSNPNWRSNRNGCPSFLINGGPTIWFEGTVVVDSTCTVAQSNAGAMKAINNSFQIIMVNNSLVRIGGEYAAGTGSQVTPVPIQHYRPLVADPLAGLTKPCNAVDAPTDCLGSNASLPTVNPSGTGSGVCKNQDPCILTPGTYTGGIIAGGGANIPNVVLLRPGIYYIRGGGMSLKSGSARIIAIPAGNATTGYTDATAKTDFNGTTFTQAQLITKFQSECPSPTPSNPSPSTCGVAIYNAPGSGGTWNTNSDNVNPGSQGALLLRAYNPVNDTIAANRMTFRSYKNLAFWQQRTPPPTGSGQTQPTVNMSGGACIVLSGTFYAPGALVDFGGNTCGAGGDNTECPTTVGGVTIEGCLAVQFIVWDLTLSGNSKMYFAYKKEYFTVPTTYGLICDPASSGDCPVPSPTPGP